MKYTQILNGWKQFVNEGMTERGPDLKYYAFDWDDNIVEMPTLIMLVDNTGDEVGMSTHAFATYREKIGKEEFAYEGKIIKDYAQNPFRNFRTEGDNQFLKDIERAEPAPAFNDFKECVEGASLFAIITARGHNPNTLKKACKIYIMSGKNGIQTSTVLENIMKYNELYGVTREMQPEEIVDDYLDKCQFYPVSFGAGSAASPEQLKVDALKEFTQYVNSQADDLRNKGYVLKNSKIQILFSDDDPKNIETMNVHFGARDPSGKFRKGGKQSIKIKHTGK